MKEMEPLIGITMGDPAGIGPEIIIKAFNQDNIYDECYPIVIGNYKVLEEVNKIFDFTIKFNKINKISEIKKKNKLINVLEVNNNLNNFKKGTVNVSCGEASVKYIMKSIDLAMDGKIDGIVTSPINKKAINKAGHNYAGHTEILADKTRTDNYAMMLVHDNLRVIHVSTHVALRKACDLVKEERIFQVSKLGNKILNKLGIERPKIAIVGLNPHSGEEGLFGYEEIKEIIPAIDRAQSNGINAKGPIPPDTAFPKVISGEYDLAVVMYHDQGHIPMKLYGSTFDKENRTWKGIRGVNITVGLPIVRTSVDHGTAYDIAGTGKADESSLIDAISLASKLA